MRGAVVPVRPWSVRDPSGTRGLEAAPLRARPTLLGVDELVRDHGAPDAALIALTLRDRAASGGHRWLQARAERALSILFREIGDPARGLEHAVAALALDGDDLDPPMRCRLPLGVADTLTLCGSFEDARTRYRETFDQARCLGTPRLSLVVLNNWAYAELLDGRLAVAMVDLDRFKAVNDTCSHQAGDAVLVRLARLLDEAAAGTPDAYAARLGGEEFLLVLPGLDLGSAHDVAEALRRRIAGHRWDDIAPGVPVTASSGLATTATADTTRPPVDRSELLREADRHLHVAKTGGRDRVEPRVDRPSSPLDAQGSLGG